MRNFSNSASEFSGGYFLVAVFVLKPEPRGMWNLSFPVQGSNPYSLQWKPSLHHWTAREVSGIIPFSVAILHPSVTLILHQASCPLAWSLFQSISLENTPLDFHIAAISSPHHWCIVPSCQAYQNYDPGRPAHLASISLPRHLGHYFLHFFCPKTLLMCCYLPFSLSGVHLFSSL